MLVDKSSVYYAFDHPTRYYEFVKMRKHDNVCYCVSVILFEFTHNPARTIGTQKVTFRVSMERLGTRQIVCILHIRTENRLVHFMLWRGVAVNTHVNTC